MIEPTSRDINRKVTAFAKGRRVEGRIASFDANFVYVRLSDATGSPAPFLRGLLDWVASDAPGPREPSAPEKAARDMLGRAGIAFEVIGDNEWRVTADGTPGTWAFWPSQGAWRRPDGTPGYGLRTLIEDIRKSQTATP